MIKKNTVKPYEGSEKYIFASWIKADNEVVLPIIRSLEESGFRIWYGSRGNLISRKMYGKLLDAHILLFFVSESSIKDPGFNKFMEDSILKKAGSRVITVNIDGVKIDGYIEFLTSSHQRINYFELSFDDFVGHFQKSEHISECRFEKTEQKSRVSNSCLKETTSVDRIKVIMPIVLAIALICGLVFAYNSRIRKDEDIIQSSESSYVNLDDRYNDNEAKSGQVELNKNSVLWNLIDKKEDDSSSEISLSVGFSSDTTEDMLSELKEFVISDPAICDMIIRAISGISPGGTRYTYKDANTWIDTYLGDVVAFDNGLFGYVERNGDKYYLSEVYLMYANEVCKFLDNYGLKTGDFKGVKWGINDINNEMDLYAEPAENVMEQALIFYQTGLDPEEEEFFGFSLKDKQIIVP